MESGTLLPPSYSHEGNRPFVSRKLRSSGSTSRVKTLRNRQLRQISQKNKDCGILSYMLRVRYPIVARSKIVPCADAISTTVAPPCRLNSHFQAVCSNQ